MATDFNSLLDMIATGEFSNDRQFRDKVLEHWPSQTNAAIFDKLAQEHSDMPVAAERYEEILGDFVKMVVGVDEKDGMSVRARELIDDMIESGSSEAIAVGECLEMIASNGDGQETDEHLIVCARQIVLAAQNFIDEMKNKNDQEKTG